MIQYSKNDIIDKEFLKKEIISETKRIFESEEARQNRTLYEVGISVKQGKTAEFLLTQMFPYLKICHWNKYHDLFNEVTNNYEEVKAYTDLKDINDERVKRSLEKIMKGRNWNKSKYMHIFSYNKETGIYTYIDKIYIE